MLQTEVQVLDQPSYLRERYTTLLFGKTRIWTILLKGPLHALELWRVSIPAMSGPSHPC